MYSIFSLARHALRGHQRWTEAWRSPAPKPAYDVVIVGGGGHGLAFVMMGLSGPTWPGSSLPTP